MCAELFFKLLPFFDPPRQRRKPEKNRPRIQKLLKGNSPRKCPVIKFNLLY